MSSVLCAHISLQQHLAGRLEETHSDLLEVLHHNATETRRANPCVTVHTNIEAKQNLLSIL